MSSRTGTSAAAEQRAIWVAESWNISISATSSTAPAQGTAMVHERRASAALVSTVTSEVSAATPASVRTSPVASA